MAGVYIIMIAWLLGQKWKESTSVWFSGGNLGAYMCMLQEQIWQEYSLKYFVGEFNIAEIAGNFDFAQHNRTEYWCIMTLFIEWIQRLHL